MIAQSEQEHRLLGLVQPIAGGLGMEIVRLRVQGGQRPHLQIMTEKVGGAPTDVEDCARLSRAISPVLDASDPITDAYTLEVSTPGIDRPLTRPGDFARWTGHTARIELARPLDGQKRFTGTLAGEDENGVHVELDENTELVVHVHEMHKASLVLTDALIAAARAAGNLPPQPDEDDLSDFEIDEDTEDTEPESTGDPA
jgi:ribosome maturation factor RimP